LLTIKQADGRKSEPAIKREAKREIDEVYDLTSEDRPDRKAKLTRLNEEEEVIDLTEAD
jgi:hypothetical protein